MVKSRVVVYGFSCQLKAETFNCSHWQETVDHRQFKLSNDPLFVEKVYDVVGLYLDPPESAVVLSVDELCELNITRLRK
jgi:hypothetical protein